MKKDESRDMMDSLVRFGSLVAAVMVMVIGVMNDLTGLTVLGFALMGLEALKRR